MKHKNTFFRTDVLRSAEVQVDRDAGIIRGFAVVSKGVTHDQRGEFDDAALDTIVSFGSKSGIGIKSRFGHPNMSSTALGTFLGRVKDFRRDGDIVRADLHIDKTAYETPDGDLAGYVMDLAKSDPAAFGASMVIDWDEEFREGKDAQGESLPPFIRVKKLFSVDVVDDPAANNGFFGMPFFNENVMPSAVMTAFLDRFLEQPGAVDRVMSFLERYRQNRNEIVKTREEKAMVQELTVDKLKAERADIFNAVRSEGFAEGEKKGFEYGVKQERERTVSILKKAAAFKEMHTLALESVEGGDTLDQATIKFQDKQLEGLKNAAPPNPGPDDEDKQRTPTTHLERAKVYQKEHNCGMTEALQATAQKRQ